jgi:hypothetical protein
MYHADRDKGKCDLHDGRRQGLVGGKARISLRLTRSTPQGNLAGFVGWRIQFNLALSVGLAAVT